MNAKMEVKSYYAIHLDIIGITLPTLEEHKSVLLNRCFKGFWWILDDKKLTVNIADSDGGSKCFGKSIQIYDSMVMVNALK